ncbi:hypothetical protein [Hyphomicrobium sp.]|jgi:hypothetical protein|uniref:hypothetical protein n=1 Tax=Hyphomicrobium sp. TaxID=82 RepID=UPI0035640251
MRLFVIAAAVLAAATPASAAGTDCSADVLVAIQKQLALKSFRIEFTQPTAEGEAHMKIDYVPPMKMLQTVTSPAMPGEQQTMLVNDRAFSGSGGSFEELQPQFTQSIVAEVTSALARPTKLEGYECLGTVKYEDQDLFGYRFEDKTHPQTDPSKAIARTIYVDPKSGLPAYNVIASLAAGAKPLREVKYSYPTDIEIVAPTNAPVQKLR